MLSMLNGYVVYGGYMAKLLMQIGYVAWLNMSALQAMTLMMDGCAVWLSMQNMMAG
jgi:hypothetical protein